MFMDFKVSVWNCMNLLKKLNHSGFFLRERTIIFWKLKWSGISVAFSTELNQSKSNRLKNASVAFSTELFQSKSNRLDWVEIRRNLYNAVWRAVWSRFWRSWCRLKALVLLFQTTPRSSKTASYNSRYGVIKISTDFNWIQSIGFRLKQLSWKSNTA